MVKRIILILACTMLVASVGLASPLTDFTKGRTAIDYNIKPNLDLESHSGIHDNTNHEWSVTTGLNGRLAVQYRQSRFDRDEDTTRFRVDNKEGNLIYKADENYQFFAGYSRTGADNMAEGNNVKRKISPQVGVIGIKDLSEKTRLYTILSGGRNLANVEFGLSYAVSQNVELNTTYRHFTAEKMDSATSRDLTMDLRGFGLGLTYRF